MSRTAALLQGLTPDEACPLGLIITAEGTLAMSDGSDVAAYLRGWMKAAKIMPGAYVNVADRETLLGIFAIAQARS